MPVFVKPFGGLGNQLFMWAAGLAVARKAGTFLVARRSGNFLHLQRKYSLDSFDSGLSAQSWLSEFGVFPRKRSHQSVLEDSLESFRHIRPGIDYELRGYFQSPLYFQSCELEVKERISKPTSPSEWFLEKFQELATMSPWTAIHVRRGDYLLKKNSGIGLLGPKYFKNGLAKLRLLERLHKKVLIFSDASAQDLAPLLAELRLSYEILVVPKGIRPIEIMLLLAQADSLILSNSTFGWWAGYLATDRSAAVVYPEPWFKAQSRRLGEDAPTGWLSVPSNFTKEGPGEARFDQ